MSRARFGRRGPCHDKVRPASRWRTATHEFGWTCQATKMASLRFDFFDPEWERSQRGHHGFEVIGELITWLAGLLSLESLESGVETRLGVPR